MGVPESAFAQTVHVHYSLIVKSNIGAFGKKEDFLTPASNGKQQYNPKQ
jgi:hypothetical protein